MNVCRIACALLLALPLACGGGSSSSERNGVDFTFDHTGVLSIRVDGREQIEALYVIGACDQRDDRRTNVTSWQAPDDVLWSPSGKCPGAPFSFVWNEHDGMLEFSVTVGPLPANYTYLSVPMQRALDPADTFASPARSGQYTAKRITEVRAGSPQPWSQWTHAGVTVRRYTYGYHDVSFISQPEINAQTVEPRWLNLRKGSTLTASERIEVQK